MRFLPTLCLLPLLAAVAMGASSAAAQDTNTPLRILVAVPAGGASDIVARALAEALRVDLARPVVVDNRPGATGLIAVDALKRAKPDGSTIFLAPIAVPVVMPLVFKNANFDPVRDLAPIAQVANFEWALAVAHSHPAKTLSEFIAWAKENRERATYGTVGVGSIPHLLGLLLARDAGIEFVHVAYKGAVEADLMGGHIAAGFGALSDLAPAHRAGKLRILAVSGAKRSSLLPDVATFTEQAFRSIEAVGWIGVFAPAKTPPATIDRLSASIARATRAPEVRDRMVALGLEPTGTTGDEFASVVATDSARWRAIVKRVGLTAE